MVKVDLVLDERRVEPHWHSGDRGLGRWLRSGLQAVGDDPTLQVGQKTPFRVLVRVGESPVEDWTRDPRVQIADDRCVEIDPDGWISPQNRPACPDRRADRLYLSVRGDDPGRTIASAQYRFKVIGWDTNPAEHSREPTMPTSFSNPTFWALALALLASSPSAQPNSDGPDMRYAVAIRIDGQPVTGAAERGALMAGKSPAEQRALMDQPLPVLPSRGARLEVRMKGPDGVWKDVTGSDRVRFEHMGCLTIAKATALSVGGPGRGAATIAPGNAGTCLTPTLPMLFVILLDEQGKALNFNEYAFRIAP